MATTLTIPQCNDPLVDLALPNFTPGGIRAFFALAANDLDGLEADTLLEDMVDMAHSLYPMLMRESVGASIKDIEDVLQLRCLMLIDDEAEERRRAAELGWIK